MPKSLRKWWRKSKPSVFLCCSNKGFIPFHVTFAPWESFWHFPSWHADCHLSLCVSALGRAGYFPCPLINHMEIPLERSDYQIGFCCSLSEISNKCWSAEGVAPWGVRVQGTCKENSPEWCQRIEPEFQCLLRMQSICFICPTLAWVTSGGASWWLQGLCR